MKIPCGHLFIFRVSTDFAKNFDGGDPLAGSGNSGMRGRGRPAGTASRGNLQRVSALAAANTARRSAAASASAAAGAGVGAAGAGVRGAGVAVGLRGAAGDNVCGAGVAVGDDGAGMGGGAEGAGVGGGGAAVEAGRGGGDNEGAGRTVRRRREIRAAGQRSAGGGAASGSVATNSVQRADAAAALTGLASVSSPPGARRISRERLRPRPTPWARSRRRAGSPR